ncbi:hypothetical protein ACFQ71_12235 [Streptomyces sp. NPDC056534]|uniref:hypothetical protein n=1 Tax=Streptomyces sp. NPDC056534 TaxID=3345857 RepID=UPI0036A2976D
MRRHTTATLTAALLLALTACSSGDGKPLDESAAIMCEDFVKQRLKSPGTAEFPGVTDSDYAKTTVLSDTKPWKYKVTGVVDSQNGLSATVRSNYECTVSTKDDDTWTLDDMKLTQR